MTLSEMAIQMTVAVMFTRATQSFDNPDRMDGQMILRYEQQITRGSKLEWGDPAYGKFKKLSND